MSSKNLLDKILNYDFQSYELFLNTVDYNLAKENKTHKMKSNSGKEYIFDYNVFFWAEEVERILRYRYPTLELMVELDKSVNWTDVNLTPQGIALSFSNWLDKDKIVYCLKLIKSRFNCDKVNIWTQPYVIYEISQDINLIQELKQRNVMITNFNSPLFCKKQIFDLHVNDQMIDWRSGLNFYTCEHQTKHFLPIFTIREGKFANLLNLSGDFVDHDDYFNFDPKNILKCKCGKNYCPFEFKSHKNNTFDLDIIEKLQGKYRHIQFIQDKKMYCYYVGNLVEYDINLIKSVWSNIEFISKPYQVYNKFPFCWKVNQ